MAKMDTSTLIALGSLLALLGGGIGIYATYKAGQESSRDTKEIKEVGTANSNRLMLLQNQNDSLRSKITELQSVSESQVSKITDLTTQNANLALQLGNAALEIKASITGDDGFCEIMFVKSDNSNFRKLVVKNHGKYPLHDLKARFSDLESLELASKSFPPPNPVTGIIELNQAPKVDEFKVDIGTVLVNRDKDLRNIVQIGKYGDKCSFNIFIEGKNREVVQLTRMFKIGNEWLNAVRIQDNISGEKLYEKIDPGFPKDKLNFK